MNTAPNMKNWWSAEWINRLSLIVPSTRFRRALDIAADGSVRNLSVTNGMITAAVSGSRVRPYRIEIKISPVASVVWNEALRAVQNEPGMVMDILSGKLPQEVINVFTQKGFDLLPSFEREFHSVCTCPDWQNPCKHIAAVCLCAAQAFDDDIFSLYSLRGLSKERLLEMMSVKSPQEKIKKINQTEFWGDNGSLDGVKFSLESKLDESVQKFLGEPPFWKGKMNFSGTLELYYRILRDKPAYFEKEGHDRDESK